MEKTIERTECQVYARVMGYLRPVSNYNVGKKSEFYSRKYFKNDKIIDNSDFLEKYKSLYSENTPTIARY